MATANKLPHKKTDVTNSVLNIVLYPIY